MCVLRSICCALLSKTNALFQNSFINNAQLYVVMFACLKRSISPLEVEPGKRGSVAASVPWFEPPLFPWTWVISTLSVCASTVPVLRQSVSFYSSSETSPRYRVYLFSSCLIIYQHVSVVIEWLLYHLALTLPAVGTISLDVEGTRVEQHGRLS
jgi:hypothetical protein